MPSINKYKIIGTLIIMLLIAAIYLWRNPSGMASLSAFGFKLELQGSKSDLNNSSVIPNVINNTSGNQSPIQNCSGGSKCSNR